MSHVNIWMVVIAWGVSTLLAFIIGSRKGKPGAGALAGILLGLWSDCISTVRLIVVVASKVVTIFAY
jgi:hypothetical protein